jgi:AraC family chitin signaling transcriptional activator
MKYKIYYLLVLLAIAFQIQAQDVLPFVENFSKSKYLGDNQVWSVTQGKDNAMYFANNHYFLRYNGVKWEKYILPNKTIIRSVFSDNDLIYTGSYKEFGYWKRISGKMMYYSLSKDKNIFKDELINEEIWKIFKHNNQIYFQSFNELFVYDGKSIKRLHVPHQISYCFSIENKIYVASVNKGISILENQKFSKQNQWKILENTIIHAIEKKNNCTYFFTKKNGIFEDSNGVLKPWNNTVLNTIFKNEIINTARFIDDNRVAIGTAFNGIYIVNITTGIYIHINRKNSLLNNSVLSIGFDNENDLWLGMDNGISHIEINSPYSIFSDNTGVLGSVYAVSPYQNGYLLGTNHGVFKYQNKTISFIEGSQGQVWQINKIDNEYIIGHNDGTFSLKNNTFTKLNAITGGWKFLKNNFSNHYFQANYAGITVYDNQNFLTYKKIEGLTKPIKNIAQNKENELWAVDSYKGLYRIELDNDLNAIKVENSSENNGFKEDYNIKLFQFKNEIFFYINNNWYKFNAIANKLEIFELFSKNFKNIADIIPIDDTQFLIVKEDLLYIIRNEKEKFYWELIPKKYYDGKIVNEDTKVVKIGNQLIINLDDGFFSIVPQASQNINYNITIEGYFNQELITNTTQIEYNQSVELQLISSYYGFNEKNIFYTLNNSNEYIPIIDGLVQLNNLSSGNQSITVYFLNENNYQKVADYSFKVKKPWYFSFWMILLYLLILSSAFFLYYKWNKIRYLEKIKLKEEELKHQKQIIQLEMDAENKLKIQDYEKHILEIQIQTKASEVASKSLSIAKQTEMIENIQKILDAEKNINTLKNQIGKVIKINSLNKNEWKFFENNLLKSNEDFVKIVTSKYKNLSSKDIKLCIYLKMNLSSKEIAPLMNIGYRGVEIHRYRLRKKLELDQEVNLNSFMNNLK